MDILAQIPSVKLKHGSAGENIHWKCWHEEKSKYLEVYFSPHGFSPLVLMTQSLYSKHFRSAPSGAAIQEGMLSSFMNDNTDEKRKR